MLTKILLLILIISGSCTLIYSQNDIQVGSPNSLNTRYNGGLYDYSDPTGVNIKVQLWGSVRYPGYYILPVGTSINELLSYGGGPTQDALLDDIRVTKIKEGGKTVMLKYNYNDLMWTSDIENPINYNKLEAGDLVVVPGEPRYFGRENFTFFFSIFSSLATLAILIINIYK